MPRTLPDPARPGSPPVRVSVHRTRCAAALLGACLLLPGVGTARAQYIGGGGLAQLHAPRRLGRWVGVLPGACNRTRAPTDVELTLWSGMGVRPQGTYRMTETCRIPGLVARVLQGSWVQLRDTTVIVLTVNGELDTRAFQRQADGSLRPLDRDLDPRRDQMLSPVD